MTHYQFDKIKLISLFQPFSTSEIDIGGYKRTYTLMCRRIRHNFNFKYGLQRVWIEVMIFFMQ